MADVAVRPHETTETGAGEYPYQRGFGNEFSSEAVPGALPAGRNSPQRAGDRLAGELVPEAPLVRVLSRAGLAGLVRADGDVGHDCLLAHFPLTSSPA